MLVLGAGASLEFGTPKALLADKDGVFYSMVEETGPANAAALHQVAAGGKEAMAEMIAAALLASRLEAEELKKADFQLKAQIEARGGVYIGEEGIQEGVAAVAMLAKLLNSAHGESEEARSNRRMITSSSWIQVDLLH